MTRSEARRRQWLRRLAPAAAVLALYAVFIGPGLNAKAAAGGQDARRLRERYMANQSQLKDRAQQKRDLQAELAALQMESGRSDARTARDIGFLGQADYAGKAIARLSAVLSQYRLRIIEDGRQDWEAAKDGIPKSVRELAEPARALGKGVGPGASLWRVRFSGAYPDVYRALDRLARDGVAVIPVSLDMVPPEGGGEMEWVLRIWI